MKEIRMGLRRRGKSLRLLERAKNLFPLNHLHKKVLPRNLLEELIPLWRIQFRSPLQNPPSPHLDVEPLSIVMTEKRSVPREDKDIGKKA